MTCHRFGGADIQFVGMFPENIHNCFCFRDITKRCRGAMNVNIIDVSWFNSGILDCQFHYACCSEAIGMRRCEVESIGTHTASDNFGIYFCPSCQGVFVFLNDKGTCSFSHYETVTGKVERPRCRLVFGIIDRHGLH